MDSSDRAILRARDSGWGRHRDHRLQLDGPAPGTFPNQTRSKETPVQTTYETRPTPPPVIPADLLAWAVDAMRMPANSFHDVVPGPDWPNSPEGNVIVDPGPYFNETEYRNGRLHTVILPTSNPGLTKGVLPLLHRSGPAKVYATTHIPGGGPLWTLAEARRENAKTLHYVPTASDDATLTWITSAPTGADRGLRALAVWDRLAARLADGHAGAMRQWPIVERCRQVMVESRLFADGWEAEL